LAFLNFDEGGHGGGGGADGDGGRLHLHFNQQNTLFKLMF